MRFDFAWNQGLSFETRSEIENIANNAISDSLEVSTKVMSLDDAKKTGAMALFGEKYGETVRVVEIGGPWSIELCAGTHVKRSSDIGLINLVGESSIGSNNRRIEALVGRAAFESFAAERAIVSALSANLKTPREELVHKIGDVLAQLKSAEKAIAEIVSKSLRERVPVLAKGAKSVSGFRVVADNVGKIASGDLLRQLAVDVRDKLGVAESVVILGAEVEEKAAVMIVLSNGAQNKGFKAGDLAKEAAGLLGGGGGGRPDIAQAGGPNIEKIDQAISAIVNKLNG
jgi:alanyl-tRNA synthetase